MGVHILPTPDLLRDILRYEPDTGKLFWKPSPRMGAVWNGKYPGKEAFTSDSGHGYKKGGIRQKDYYSHRVIWALVHGKWPENEIDHINCVRSDNRLQNLREATRVENCRNIPKHFDGSSGYKGVRWHNQRKKWAASIRVDGKNKHLGLFGDAQDAHKAYVAAAEKHFGEFSRG